MAAEPIRVPVPVCEMCWLSRHTSWEPESMDSAGRVIMHLTGVEVPKKYNTGTVELCADCGEITISGIYDLRKPEDINYADEELLGNVDEEIYDDPTRFILSIYRDTEEDDYLDEK